MIGLSLLLSVPVHAAPRLPDGAVEDELPAWRTHGEEVRLTAARELLKLGNTFAALDIIRQMRAEKYDTPELDLIQGEALRVDGVVSEAERLLLLADKRMGRDARPSAELCILYADMQQVEDAIHSCERATDIDPTDAASWNNLGYLQLSAGRPVDALEASEQAVQVDATQARYRNNLGLAQAALGKVEIAFRTLKSTMPTGDAAYMIGLVRERFSGLDEAGVWMERAVKYDPQHPQARAWLADRDGAPAVSMGDPRDAASSDTPSAEGAPAPTEVP